MKEEKKQGIYQKYIKRLLDIILSLIAIIVLSPLLLVVAILVRTKLGSPVIFNQERPGKDEKIFKLYKFRSMTDERDENGELLPDDERLTRFGRSLRATSLDEIPELFNILKGDMSIVGPRPLLVQYLPYYTEEERKRHSIRPGLTGLAQVNGRNAISWDKKLTYDVKYVSNISFIGDLKIVVATFYKTIKKSDIKVGKEFKAGNFIEQRSRGLSNDKIR
ncbi:MAG: sugar transferase [Tissierellia bacterium]|nr:sugar transferase [Tissierellia bacterium]